MIPYRTDSVLLFVLMNSAAKKAYTLNPSSYVISPALSTSQTSSLPSTQRLQYPLIKEYTLSLIWAPRINLRYIFLN